MISKRLLPKAGVVMATLIPVIVCACSVAVSVGAFNPVKEQQYDASWNAGWSDIAMDSKPLQATTTSPGVCNDGGSRQGCYDADTKLISDLDTLAKKLRGSLVPSEFARANSTILEGIAADIRGLKERDTLIWTRDEQGTFAQSNQSLKHAQSLFNSSIGEFRGPDTPRSPFTNS